MKGEYMELASMEMGQRIRYLRELLRNLYDKKGFTTVEVAERVQIKQQSLTAIELGETKNPKFMVIYGLSRAFNVPMEAFTDDFYETQGICLFSIGFDDEPRGDEESGKGKGMGTVTMGDACQGVEPGAGQGAGHGAGPEIVDLGVQQNQPGAETKDGELPFRVGLMVYQLLDEEQMRLVLTRETKFPVEARDFVELMSRIFNELKLLDARHAGRLMYSSEYENLYNRALNVYHGIFKDPGAFPVKKVHEFRRSLEPFAGSPMT
jgi:transcriptional regulator with XRE-family HTH domain